MVAARKFPNSTKRTAITSSAPSDRFVVTVASGIDELGAVEHRLERDVGRKRLGRRE
jgi:hypothetical protein